MFSGKLLQHPIFNFYASLVKMEKAFAFHF